MMDSSGLVLPKSATMKPLSVSRQSALLADSGLSKSIRTHAVKDSIQLPQSSPDTYNGSNDGTQGVSQRGISSSALVWYASILRIAEMEDS